MVAFDPVASGKRLEEFLKFSGLKRQEFADATQTTKANLSNYILGKSPISAKMLCAMSIVFPECNLSWILSGIGLMVNPASESSEVAESAEPYGIDTTMLLLLKEKDEHIKTLSDRDAIQKRYIAQLEAQLKEQAAP